MEKQLQWWQLSLLGVACMIGTGFFLASSIAIEKAGNAVIISYFISGLGTFIVFHTLAEMFANHPEKGSFRTYAKSAFGPFVGFAVGWVYWVCEMLIMGSQLAALSIFARYWFPQWPLWIFSLFFAILGLLIILTGLKGFERIENLFAVIKLAAIIMFILVVSLFLFDVIGADSFESPQNPLSFTGEPLGIWSSLLYTYYAFGGIEVLGLLMNELKDQKSASKSGIVMIGLLTVLYAASIWAILSVLSVKHIQTDESPFITTLNQIEISFLPHIFNGVLIIAGFSTFVASLYAIITILITLAEDGDAPKKLAEKGKRKVPIRSFFVLCGGVFLSILFSFLLPKSVYEYVTTAAGLMLLYTWFIILFSYYKLLAKTKWDKGKVFTGSLLLFLALSGSLLEKSTRISFFVSIGFLIVVFVATLFKRKLHPQS